MTRSKKTSVQDEESKANHKVNTSSHKSDCVESIFSGENDEMDSISDNNDSEDEESEYNVDSSSEEEDSHAEDEEEDVQPSNKKKQLKNLVQSLLKRSSSIQNKSQVAPKTNIEQTTMTSEEEEEEDDTDDNDSDSGDEYFMSLPKGIRENKEMFGLYEKIKTYINRKRTPNLATILKSKMSFKRKVELVESMIILDNCEPFSEEYLQIRGIIMKLVPMFKKEYKENKIYKESLKILEKNSSTFDNLNELPIKILNLKTTEENKQIIYRKYMEFRQMSRDDEEYGKLERWLKQSLQLPFDNLIQGSIPNTVDSNYLSNVRKKLDEVLYGMSDVKEQIILFLHVRLLNPSIRGCSLGLIGPPGCGKTTIARSLADIIEYPFQQISFGGVNSSDYLKGYNYTYVGSRPGEIVNCLIRMKNKNGILFFDEYDKISENPDIVSTLLHVTDFSQNSSFRDNYFSDIEIDISSLWFIYSMNELPENSALRDRIFPIFINGYTEKEKVRIIVDYLFPRHLKEHLFQKTDIIVSDQVAALIISKVCKSSDKGIRSIEKAVKDIIRKVSFLYHHDITTSFQIKQPIVLPLILTPEMISTFLDRKGLFDNGNTFHLQMYS